jgi:hypothetical protein
MIGRVVILGFAVAVGLIAGALSAGRAPSPQSASVANAAPACVSAAGTTALSAQQIATLVRSELEAALAKARAPTTTAVAPSPEQPAARSREQRDADQTAMDVVQSAIGSRVWTREDVARVRGLMVRSSPTGRIDALTRLARAINDGEIRLGFSGPPI